MKRAVFLFVRRLETVALCEGVRVPESHQDLGVEAFGGADQEENVAERRIRVDERPGHKCNKDGNCANYEKCGTCAKYTTCDKKHRHDKCGESDKYDMRQMREMEQICHM